MNLNSHTCFDYTTPKIRISLMSVQTKKVSKKNKVSPNDTELEAQFYVAQRAKSSRVTKGPKLSQSSNGNYESQEPILGFSKESIPYIDKQIFLQDSFEEIKEMNTIPSEPTMEIDEGVIQDLPKNNEGNEEKEASNDILRIFDNQYMPPKHLFREKESKEILDFIIRYLFRPNS